MTERLIARICALTGENVIAFRPATGGYTPALRGQVTLGDGTTVFAKIGVNKMTADWLRAEDKFYRALSPKHNFLPRFLVFGDTGDDAPILLLEDLTPAHWPPPWKPGQVEQVLETLARVRAALPDAPLDTPHLKDYPADIHGGWPRVAANPNPFLSLGFCTEKWLTDALPSLLAAANEMPLEGNDLLHLDTRSDNLCFSGNNGTRVVLVDWNHTSRGNGLVDIAFWLPSLHMEGGPSPDDILPDAPACAAAVAGFFAARAGQPVIPDASHVRTIQKTQLKTALPWAARALKLPTPLCDQ